MREFSRGDDWRGLRRVFRLPATGGRMSAEVDAELHFHLEGRIEDIMVREGLTREQAEAEARRRFGDIAEYRRQLRDIDQTTHRRRERMEILDTIRREGRQSLRTLRRSPSFSVIALVTLAIGLGATTAIFTLLDRIVIRPLPYANAERLIHLGTRWPGFRPDAEFGISRYMFFRFEQESATLQHVGLYLSGGYMLPGGDGHDAERITGVNTSASLFDVLGIRPAHGRLYTAEEERQPDAPVVLLTHSLWMRRFGGDPGVIGRTIDVGGRYKEVVGILPPSAQLPDRQAEIWEPLYLDPSAPPQNHHTFRAIGLLKQGVRVERAYAELDALTRRIIADHPNVYSPSFLERTGFAFTARSLHNEVVGPRVSSALWILFAFVGIVLLISAANIANLFLVRIDVRRREMAMRTALGADRRHLAAHYLGESLLLALAAAAAAIAPAYALLRVALALAPASLPRLAEVGLNWRSVAFCAGMALIVGVVFGLLPLAQHALDVAMLREGGRGLTSSRARNAARRTLVVTQVALALVLLASAGLMAKSFDHLRSVRPGFDARGVLAMNIALRPDRYTTDQQLVAFWHELARRVEALPGVQHTGAAEQLPLTGGDGCTAVWDPDAPPDDLRSAACVPTLSVTPGYFASMGIRVQGEAPGWAENEQGAGTMVVSRALAERFWPGENAIGKSLTYAVRRQLTFRITGIAEDVRANGLHKPPVEAAYFPIAAPAVAGSASRADMNGNYLSFVVRSDAKDLQQLGTAIRRIVGEMDPHVPVSDVQPMEVIVAKSMAQTSFTMLLLVIAATIALVLSAVGIYGVISYFVEQRRGEIGIRMALGAQIAQVGRMVVGESLALVAFGVCVGVLGAVAVTRVLRALLFEVSPTDPAVIIVSAVALLAVALVASYAPARRAARVDPMEALRAG
jgi:predicted permease